MTQKYIYRVLAFALAAMLAFMGVPSFGLTAVAETGADLDINAASAGTTDNSVDSEISGIGAGIALFSTSVQASDFATLQAAINSAPTDGTEVEIEIINDIQLESELTIAAGKNIKIWSAAAYTLKASSDQRLIKVNGELTLENNVKFDSNGFAPNSSYGGGLGSVYIYNNGVFTMNGGKISGSPAGGTGGVRVGIGTFIMNDGVISDNTASEGGGVSLDMGAFIMNGGEISGNSASAGGGVSVTSESTFIMNGGKIISNTAHDGGGVYIGIYDIFTMNDGEISGNDAIGGSWRDGNGRGGGVFVEGGGVTHITGSFTMKDGEISNNVSDYDGGGVFLGASLDYNDNMFTMTGGKISGNQAAHNGGGICYGYGFVSAPSPTYVNLDIGSAAIFSGNTASGAPRVYDGTPDVTNYIKTTSSSYAGLHPLNNHDINYEPIALATYGVTFKDYNGTTLKTETVTEGQAATAPTNPTRTGYTFTGWDTDFSNVTSNLTVTAQYSINAFTVTFKDWNGTTLKTQTVNYGGAATAPSAPTRAGYNFIGWDKTFSNITSNLIVTAQYQIKSNVTIIDVSGTYDLSNNSFNGDYLITADNVNVYSMYLNGNLYIESNNVNIHDGTINGNVVTTGHTVTIKSFYISGDVSIGATNTTIQDSTIGGNLTIEKTVENGNVILERVNARSSTVYVKGGGSNSVEIIDSQIGVVQIDKPITANQQRVRVVAKGNTTVNSTVILSSALVQNQNLGANSTGLGNVTLSTAIPSNSEVSLSGNFNAVTLQASNISVEVASGNVNNLIVTSTASNATIFGAGQIVAAQVSDNVRNAINLNIQPQSLTYISLPNNTASDKSSNSNTYTSGSPASITSNNVNADGSVNSGKISTELTAAIKASEHSVITLKIRNAKTISASTLRSLAELAAKHGRTVMLHADTYSDKGSIQGRLYIDASKLSALKSDISLEVFAEGAIPTTRKSFFEKHFKNNIAAISCVQQGGFGAPIQIAAKVNLSEIDSANLSFYSYSKETNTYSRIINPDYRIDKRGYLHFTTSLAGDIIVSEGALVKK